MLNESIIMFNNTVTIPYVKKYILYLLQHVHKELIDVGWFVCCVIFFIDHKLNKIQVYKYRAIQQKKVKIQVILSNKQKSEETSNIEQQTE